MDNRLQLVYPDSHTSVVRHDENRVLLREVGSETRAFLSDRYKRMDSIIYNNSCRN